MRTMRDLVRPLTRGERGDTLVEFAIASTVFFMVVFGTIEFGIGVWRYNLVSDLAQEGARYASVHGSTSTSPASSADVQTYVRARALGLGSNITVTATPAPSTLTAGSTVSVLVTHNFTPLTTLLPHTTLTLRNTASMLVTR